MCVKLGANRFKENEKGFKQTNVLELRLIRMHNVHDVLREENKKPLRKCDLYS